MTYTIDLDALTVIATDDNGERFDMNAGGEPCANTDDLRAFVNELAEQGAYTDYVRDVLLASF